MARLCLKKKRRERRGTKKEKEGTREKEEKST
jgi:hypothetical protein